jgi:hypothetical protein
MKQSRRTKGQKWLLHPLRLQDVEEGEDEEEQWGREEESGVVTGDDDVVHALALLTFKLL